MSVSLIPESAPFTDEQRAWLNGFLAGWTGIVDTGSSNGAAVSGAPIATAWLDDSSDDQSEGEDFPWHDPALEIDQRLELAKERPYHRRLMAAMAQLDCGACGYVCKTYGEAIADGSERNLTLCSPGGKETARLLKKLVKERRPQEAANGAANGKAPLSDPSTISEAVATGYNRSNPFLAKIKSSINLNAAGSSKQTSHVVIDLGDSGLDYKVGDSLGVYPTNCTELVDSILHHVDATDPEPIRSQLIERDCLRTVTDELLELLSSKCTAPAERASIEALIESDDLDDIDVLDALRNFPHLRLQADGFAACLVELAPRLYSIASSHRANPGEVHLTVGRTTTTVGDRTYKGVASTMLADRITAGTPLRIYVHPSHGFTVPTDPNAPIIMVGPGTGIAPFRAFLQERNVTGARGKNWLFFGDQQAATDFLYQEELEQLLAAGNLTRLSLAFSRDQQHKIYVQDRMREEGTELYAWLEEGAYFFVCGDAKRMATDVDRTLHEIIETHGRKSPAEAGLYIDALKSQGRYLRDVY